MVEGRIARGDQPRGPHRGTAEPRADIGRHGAQRTKLAVAVGHQRGGVDVKAAARGDDVARAGQVVQRVAAERQFDIAAPRLAQGTAQP